MYKQAKNLRLLWPIRYLMRLSYVIEGSRIWELQVFFHEQWFEKLRITGRGLNMCQWR